MLGRLGSDTPFYHSLYRLFRNSTECAFLTLIVTFPHDLQTLNEEPVLKNLRIAVVQVQDFPSIVV